MAGNQVDLFLDTIVDAPIKDERALMEFPFFSLQKQARKQPLVYDDGTVRIEVSPGPKGMATIWDKDILIYLASILNDRVERGEEPSHTIRFAAYDFLKLTGRGTGKRAYELFLDALRRLRSTTIETTIEAAGQTERRGFGWVETWRVLERESASGKSVMAGVEVTLNDWMFRSIVEDQRVLTINRDYFQLTRGLDRRLYELARKHVGNQPEWYVSLGRLYEKCGSMDTLRKFKMRIRAIGEEDQLPDYGLKVLGPAEAEKIPHLNNKPGTVMVKFWRRAATQVQAVSQAKAPPRINAMDAGNAPPRVTLAAIQEAQARFPGRDPEWLEREWQQKTAANGMMVRNPDAAFLAWAAAYCENHPLS